MEKMTNTNYPNNLNAEKELLGSMLLHSVEFEEIFAVLKPEMFYNYAHQLIFSAIMDAFRKHGKVDMTLTEQALIEKGNLEKAGGVVKLTELFAQADRFENYLAHLTLIRESYILRRIMIMSHTLCVKASTEQYASGLLIDECNAQLNELMQINDADDRVFSSRTVMDSVVAEYEDRKANAENGKTNGLLTGINRYDQISNGLQKGDLTIFAGRPSMGKTAVAIHMAMQIAKTEKHVLIFSLEMTAVQLGNRMMLNESDIPVKHFKAGTLYTVQEGLMRSSAEKISTRSITIADTPGISAAQIRNIALRQQRNVGVDVIFIDYLQLVQSGNNILTRHMDLSQITKACKNLAKELDIPVVLLSQLNRNVEARTDRRPLMSDLRESGAIEEDADIIGLLYRDEYYNRDSELKNEGEIIVAKFRNGPTGVVRFKHDGEMRRFE